MIKNNIQLMFNIRLIFVKLVTFVIRLKKSTKNINKSWKMFDILKKKRIHLSYISFSLFNTHVCKMMLGYIYLKKYDITSMFLL